MKIVKNILLVLWCIFCTVGIVRNFSHYDFVDWIIIFFVITVPILLIILIFRPRNDKVFQVPSSGLIQTETEQSKDYIETQNLVMHTDNSEISDSEVLKLMQDGLESRIAYEKESPNPVFHRTFHEHDLSFHFEEKYGDRATELSDAFESAFQDAQKSKNYNKKIKKYEEALKLYYKAKKFCYSKGKGGSIYFQDMWECMHNSKNPCFSYESVIIAALEEAKIIQNDIIPQILEILSSNEEGILQTDLYHYLPNYNPSLIRKIIKELNEKEQINMVSKGKSYLLSLKTGKDVIQCRYQENTDTLQKTTGISRKAAGRS